MVSIIMLMAIASITSIPAAAKDVPSKGPQKLMIEEIVVTARKKEESVQDVPLAITAVSADQIEAAGISSLDDVAAFTPGLIFTNLYGEFLSVPVIRGIAPTAIFRENNAAIFIDGVFVSGREGLNASQLDLERIEVLKGPQSTKYGRNAFSGAINMVTARPTDVLEGKADVTIGSDEKRQARVSVSGPLIDNTLLGRVAVGIDEWAGPYNNNLSRVNIGGYQYKTLQTSLWWTPSDAWDIQWAVYLSDDEIDQSPLQSVGANCEDRLDLQDIAPQLIEDPANPGSFIPNPDQVVTTRPQNYCGTLQSLADNTMGAAEGAVGEERELVRSSLNLDWNFGFGSLASLTGYSKTKQSAITDGSRDPGTVWFSYQTTSFESAGFQGEELEVSPGDETTEYSQELRFSSSPDSRFRYDIGGYFYDVELQARSTDVVARLTGDSGLRLPADFETFWPLVVGDAIWLGTPEDPSWFLQEENDISTNLIVIDDENSWSVFTGVEFDLGDSWVLDAGVRYTDTTKELTQFDPDGVTVALNTEDSWDFWTGRAGITAHASDSLMVYTSIANGKKPGGFDSIEVDLIPLDGSPPIPDVARVFRYDVEENTTVELGSKGTFDRAQYDVAIFYTDWTNILLPQVIEVDPVTGLPFDQPTGVDQTGGDATVYGIEASTRILISEHWSTDLGFSWTEAEFDDADLATYRLFPSFWTDTNGDGRGDSGDISGKTVLRQSKIQGNATVDYRRPIFTEWDFYTRGDVLYQGSQWVGSANQAKIPDHTYVNLRLGFDSEQYQVELWAQNLFDDDNPVAAFRDVFFNNTINQGATPSKLSGDLFPFRMTVRHPRRRTYGVTVRVRF
jgi:iron complex outermembrane receptor protein